MGAAARQISKKQPLNLAKKRLKWSG